MAGFSLKKVQLQWNLDPKKLPIKLKKPTPESFFQSFYI